VLYDTNQQQFYDMDHYREIKNNLAWHNEGKFEVELINGTITRLNFCEPGKGIDDPGHCLTSTNFKFLQAVYTSLGDLFTFIDEENKRLGYSYARKPDALPEDANANSEQQQTQETILRPLINYDHEEAIQRPLEEDIKLRDIG